MGYQQLSLVRVISNNLSFGCMMGRLEGTDIPVTLNLVTDRKEKLLVEGGNWPRAGDLVGCEHVVHSVYLPKVLMIKEELEAQNLLRRAFGVFADALPDNFLPYDIADTYFGIRRPIVRVEC